MVKCPKCGIDISEVKKEWDYAVFHVKMYVCDRCGKSIRAYYWGNKFSHTIPKSR